MDSRITSGPGGQPRSGQSADRRPSHDVTMQLSVLTPDLLEAAPAERPVAVKPEPADRTPLDTAPLNRPPLDKTSRTRPSLDKTRLNRPERLEQPVAAGSAPDPRSAAARPEPVEWTATQEVPVFNPLPAIPSQQGHDRPVFVDASGRRGKNLRRLGWLCGLAATGFAVALVGSLLGGNSRAPGLNLPDGSKADAVTAPPQATAPQVPQAPRPKASPKKAVAPTHSGSRAPSPKTSKSAAKTSRSATPVSGHSPANTKVSPRPGTSKKPAAGTVSPSGGKTGA
ncbi:hypothetical protein [Streptomyces sp. NPDC048111]|uniref:hypothetical protein n=1 Tax=Streptomyces sp. NPDC048111 TaxID=3365500 RepID=UPI003714B8D7